MHKYVLMISILAAGCGTSSGGDGAADTPATKQTTTPTPSGAVGTGALAFNTAAELPACDTSRDHQLVYVIATKQFQTCQAGAWTVIEIAAPTGPAGEDGADGKNGTDGKDGAAGKDGTVGSDNRITKSIECYGSDLDGLPDVEVSYIATVMASGDVFATGMAKNDVDSSSRTQFYSASQTALVASAPVQVTKDAMGTPTAGFFKLELDRDSLVLTVSYVDAEIDPSVTTWTLQPEQCTVREF